MFFRPGTLQSHEFIDIESVIYAATGNKIPRWESSTPKVIEQYLDKIETYFSGEYIRNKDGLLVAQKEISEASWKAYYETVGKVDDEAFSQGGARLPEPKRKPIIYYPLMIIIILLILGGLVTLGMVLLDRFFSLF